MERQRSDTPPDRDAVERGGFSPDELVPPPDQPQGSEDNVTVEEQRDGDSLDERLARDRSERDRRGPRGEPGELVDEDPDKEKDTVADEAGEPVADEEEAAEESAMRTETGDRAPGVTEGPDRYVEEP
ncbi:MAG TPA: hypothetical protein VE754_01845 [Actinomycetota bacterium]|nr:hypothetical protein [Actinomycetota bacterium]